MNRERPPATVSVDLDDLWTYLKSGADPRWETCGTFLDRAIPRFLELFAESGVRATFFVVGRDARDPVKARLFRALVEAGHEVGNHTQSHDLWLCAHGDERVEREIVEAEETILWATGERPVGFRGPGFAIDGRILRMLAGRGYAYDASTWPTVVTGLARWYLFVRTRMGAEDRRRRAAMGGGLGGAYRPLRPYRHRTEAGGLWELPVTTVPWVRLPMHPSFLQVPAGLSPVVARAWFGLGLGLCRVHGIVPSVLFHPTDLLGLEDADAPGFIPGTRRPLGVKRALAREVMRMLCERFEVMPLREFTTRNSLAGGLAAKTS